ncbi:MAG: carbon-nitrogen family hydrolase [Desulfatibacillaceae bacterium]
MRSFVVGAVQFDVYLGETERNVERAVQGLNKLKERGARLAVLPEMFTCGFDNENLAEHAGQTPGILDRLAEVAEKLGMVIVGSLPELDDELVYNTAHVIGPDGVVAGTYRKVHLFAPTGERDYFAAGKSPKVVDTHLGRLGLVICYDLRFPELCRALTERGADMLVVMAQWPTVRIQHWDILCQARAVENQLWVIACNRVGQDGKLLYGGQSRVVSPWGRLPATGGNKSGLLTAEVDLKENETYRKAIPCMEQKVYSIDVP